MAGFITSIESPMPTTSDRSTLPAHPSLAFDSAALRAAEFPHLGTTIYLDAASIGPLPERTRRAVEAFSLKRAAPHLLGHEDLFGLFAESRRLAARLVNADSSEIALTTNTSFGLTIAARALPLEPGDVILLSDKEFPANVYPWMRLKSRGVILELIPTTAEGWPDEHRMMERLGDPRVRVLAVSLTQFSNGYTVDLARLSAATRASGAWLVVDAIQSLGQMPVDLQRTPVDILSCGAQKWLLSPWGAGFMYVRKELISQLDPVITGWMAFEGTDDFSRMTQYNDTLRNDARRFELITLPFQDFAGMNVSLDLLLSIEPAVVREHLRRIHQPVLEWAARHGVRLASPVGERGSGIIAVAPPDLERRYRALKPAGVACSLREGAIRLSPHCYNSVDEMARVAALLERNP